MQLKKLILNNFRNYSLETITPGDAVNVLFGNNAQGKTNLLEAVYYLFSTVSHRTRKDKELIRWDEKFFKLHGEILINEQKKTLDLTYEITKKKGIKINKNPEKVEKYFSMFPVVIFYPQDVYLITGGPAERRRFLNTEIIRLTPAYYHYLLYYYRALRQRNNILKHSFKKKEDLSSWDNILASYGSKIILTRIAYLKKLGKAASGYQEYFTSGGEKLQLSYRPRFETGDFNDFCNISEEKIKEKFVEELEKKREEEFHKGYTLTGPQAEDFSIFLNNREIKKSSSQGQQRTTVISLKLAQAEILYREKDNEAPVLLMDDCFSELDKNRRQLILELINIKRWQCLITSYEKLEVPEAYPALFFEINKGAIKGG